jgi:hypothetical protein
MNPIESILPRRTAAWRAAALAVAAACPAEAVLAAADAMHRPAPSALPWHLLVAMASGAALAAAVMRLARPLPSGAPMPAATPRPAGGPGLLAAARRAVALLGLRLAQAGLTALHAGLRRLAAMASALQPSAAHLVVSADASVPCSAVVASAAAAPHSIARRFPVDDADFGDGDNWDMNPAAPHAPLSTAFPRRY